GLALASDRMGDHELARRAWATAFAGSVVSPALLVSDLGRPARFLHMLRMFKVTSPMSVGSWVLAGFGTATAPAAAHALLHGALGPVGRGAQVASAVLGLLLAAYSAALIANTAVPVWHHARIELPFVFTAGAATSPGAVAERWAIFRAGFQSAARPQDTIDPQRRRIREGRRKGAARLWARTGAAA